MKIYCRICGFEIEEDEPRYIAGTDYVCDTCIDMIETIPNSMTRPIENKEAMK